MTGLGVLAPWLLGALAAAAIPVIAHLARAEPPEGRGFPSLMFLKRVPFPSRARRRVRDRALLALRLLALLALVLAFAGPYPLYDGAAAPPPGRDTVVLVDVSYSMSAPGVFDAAREAAGEAVDEALAEGRVAVVSFDSAPLTVSGLDEGAAAARQALSGLAPGPGATDLARALEGAERLLAASVAGARRVVLVTDLQAASGGREPRLREDIELAIRAVGAPRPGNLALTAAWIAHGARAADGPTVLRARVANTGGEPAAGTLRIAVDGLDGDSHPLTLGPGEAREIPLPLFPAAERPTRVHLSLDADGGASGLIADDHLYRVLARRRPVDVLLVQPPGAPPYLDAALALARDPALRVVRRAPAAVTPDDVVAAEVVILDGAAPADAALLDALDERVSAGGGLLWLAGERSGALPGSLLPAVGDVVSPGPHGSALGDLAPGHPLSAAGAGDGTAAAAPLSAVTAWRYRRVTPAAGDEVLARFDGGDPALLARARGDGRVLALATSVAPEWSTLALEPVFVPLLLEGVAWIAGRPELPGSVVPGSAVDAAETAAAAAGGEALARALAAGDALRVRAPGGAERRIAEGASVVLDAPGFHELRAGDAAALPVAVSVDARESQFRPLTEAAFRERLRRGPAPAGRAPGALRGGEPDRRLAHGLLALAAALLLLESVLARRITRRRARAAAREATA